MNYWKVYLKKGGVINNKKCAHIHIDEEIYELSTEIGGPILYLIPKKSVDYIERIILE